VLILGINVVSPTHNFEVSGTVAFPSLTDQPQSNVVLVDTASGQLYYTSSAAIGGGGSSVVYVSGSNPTITGIQVEDYDVDVTVTFTNGVLKFVFGAPTAPSITSFTLNGFETNRFNKMLDTYTTPGVFSAGGYTLISASIYTGSTLVTSVGSGTTISNAFNTSGSQTYWLYVTASNPSNGKLQLLLFN